MTNEELAKALINRRPIIFEGLAGETAYNYVSAIIHRLEGGRIVISAELQDACANSVNVVDPSKIRYADTDNLVKDKFFSWKYAETADILSGKKYAAN